MYINTYISRYRYRYREIEIEIYIYRQRNRFAIELGAALVIIVGFYIGLPLLTTHCQVDI